MYKELVQTKSLEEIKSILEKQADDFYFNPEELKSVEHKNSVKSLGARYLIKISLLDFFALKDEFKEIEIKNEESGKPTVMIRGKVNEMMNAKRISHIQASISHSRNYISTLVVLEYDV